MVKECSATTFVLYAARFDRAATPRDRRWRTVLSYGYGELGKATKPTFLYTVFYT